MSGGHPSALGRFATSEARVQQNILSKNDPKRDESDSNVEERPDI